MFVVFVGRGEFYRVILVVLCVLVLEYLVGVIDLGFVCYNGVGCGCFEGFFLICSLVVCIVLGYFYELFFWFFYFFVGF